MPIVSDNITNTLAVPNLLVSMPRMNMVNEAVQIISSLVIIAVPLYINYIDIIRWRRKETDSA